MDHVSKLASSGGIYILLTHNIRIPAPPCKSRTQKRRAVAQTREDPGSKVRAHYTSHFNAVLLGVRKIDRFIMMYDDLTSQFGIQCVFTVAENKGIQIRQGIG